MSAGSTPFRAALAALNRRFMWTITAAVVAPAIASHGFRRNQGQLSFAEYWCSYGAAHVTGQGYPTALSLRSIDRYTNSKRSAAFLWKLVTYLTTANEIAGEV